MPSQNKTSPDFNGQEPHVQDAIRKTTLLAMLLPTSSHTVTVTVTLMGTAVDSLSGAIQVIV